ncbi:MAG: CRISPR-associated protein Csy3 [Cocleimonas sp.]|jgi:CRISPR-associated protein Csy3
MALFLWLKVAYKSLIMTHCRQLNYQRSLSPGKAVFYYKTADSEFNPIEVEESRITGTKSGFSEAYNTNLTAKNVQPQDLAYSNIHAVDVCYVPPCISEIYCRFSLRVNANSLEPLVCDSDEVRYKLKQLAFAYKDLNGYKELALRVCRNILQGNWLWRNQNSCDTSIEITTTKGNCYCVTDARTLTQTNRWCKQDEATLDEFSDELAEALSNPCIFWSADILAKLRTDFCQEIYPSQRFMEDKSKGNKSKVLLTVDTEGGKKSVCFGAFKVGAALQCIDDWWHEDADYSIRVNEYGADKKRLISLRHPSLENDFYTFLTHSVSGFIECLSSMDNYKEIPGDIHYFMSVLMKGGMFQTKGKTPNKESN